MKRLKIGLFIDSYFPMIDGVTVVVHNYAKHLSKYADVTVFTAKPNGDFDDSTLPYEVVRNKVTTKLPLSDYRTPLPKLDPKFVHNLNSHDLDIVHIHSAFGVGKMGVKYAKKHNIPSLFTMHSQHLRDFYDRTKVLWFSQLVIKDLCRVINKTNYQFAVNAKTADLWHQYGVKNLPSVLLNATDLSYLNNPNLIQLIKAKHNLDKVHHTFIYVGRIDVLKRLDFTLRVLKILKEAGLKFKMFFVGGGKYFEPFEKLIEELDLINECVMLGKIYNRELLSAYYQVADLQIFPSTYDTCSLVKQEAASQKTPTIFAKGSFASSTIIPDQNGYSAELIEELFANKIIDILSDSAKLKQVSENAYHEVYAHWDDRISEVHDLYNAILADWHNNN